MELNQFDAVTQEPIWEHDTLDDNPILQGGSQQLNKIIPQFSPSRFTEFAFRMPREDGQGYSNFSFKGRRHMKAIYDSPADRILLICGRQVEKSTLLGNIAIARMCLIPAYKVLYVSPSATQTKTFSNDRLKDPIETSPVLKRYTTKMLSSNILEKQLINRSKITLRYAFLNADRTRGIPAWMLEVDEFQDILSDNIPVMEECTSHAPAQWKSFVYSGTPKSLDNNIEFYRSRRSTQGEWVVPCHAHGGDTGKYWNVLGEKNIGKKGLVCEKCHSIINPMDDASQWARQVAYHPVHVPFESFRIPQLMVPWKPWREILISYESYARDQFYNEVLGISFDSGMRPLTLAQVKSCCNEEISMGDLSSYKQLGYSQPIFAGLDWGCHDEETRILTETGFKYFRDLMDDDKVAQWDPDTREMTFVIPKVRTVRKWDKPLLHFQTRGGLDLMVTGTHRMRVGISQGEQWVTESADELVERGGNVTFVGCVTWKGSEVSAFTLPGLPVSPGYGGSEDRTVPMDDWLELLGYLISEGGLCFNNGRPSCLKMSQRMTVNFETYMKMQGCLDRLRIPFKAFPNPKTGDVNWTIYGKQFWQWYANNVGTTGATKRVPREFMKFSQRQLRILWQALVDGDGSVDTRPSCTGGSYSSTSKGLCEDFQELCIKLGLRAVLRQHREAVGNKKTQWCVCWSEGRDHHFSTPSTSVERVPYSGKVYCCSVPTGYIVTERNGCIAYQGNTGEHSYTLVTLGTYINMKFRIFYVHRFVGEDTEPERQLEKIVELLSYFNVRLIGADYGGGFAMNHHLIRKYGANKVMQFQYMARAKKKVDWDGKLRRWKVARTEVMSDIFNAIKRKQLEFPRWAEFVEPYAMDMLNIYSEYNNSLRMLQYMHRQDKPDDTFHSILYCMLASMIIIKRPDIISPEKEVDGKMVSAYTGPISQG